MIIKTWRQNNTYKNNNGVSVSSVSLGVLVIPGSELNCAGLCLAGLYGLVGEINPGNVYLT